MDRSNYLWKKFEDAARILGCECDQQNLISIKFRSDCVNNHEYEMFVDFLRHHEGLCVADVDSDSKNTLSGRGWVVSAQSQQPILLVEHETGLELILQYLGHLDFSQMANVMTVIGFLTGKGLPQIIAGIWQHLRPHGAAQVEVRKVSGDGTVVELPLPMNEERMWHRHRWFDFGNRMPAELLNQLRELERRVAAIESAQARRKTEAKEPKRRVDKKK